MRHILILGGILVLLMALVFPALSQGQEPPDNLQSDEVVEENGRPTNQLIIKFSDPAAEAYYLGNQTEGTLSELSATAGVSLAYARPMSLESHVLRLPAMTPYNEVAQIAADLSQLAGVEYAEPDRILSLDRSAFQAPVVPEAVPNDPRWNEMWHLQYVPGTSEGVNLVPAWDITTGSASTVVAVLDTGILAHTDLAGKTVPGYDFIGDLFVANDGNGRDSDPSDPGDWVLANECGYTHPAQNSSWHGTHVAGTIGAATNNSVGIAGVNWHAKILPVRVLGKCGGYTSDIVDGMRWSAGLSVVGVPNNGNPAKVLNLSLGGEGTCSASEQNAINQIVAAGSTIVVAAGNDNMNVSNFSPANCTGVIAVAATNRTGNKASYSNFGSLVKVSGPGGEGGSNGVLSTLDTGTQGPANSNTYAFSMGTSMATPHVAGVASLIVGLRPAYTPAQVLALLQSTARPFPAGSTCNTSNCGSGIVDAYQALSFLNFVPTNFVYLPTVAKPAPPPPPPPPTCVPETGDSNNINDALTTCSGHTASGQVSDDDWDDVYKIMMQAGQYLLITMNGVGGDADLYLYPPGTTDIYTDPYVASSTNWDNNELISGQVLDSGYWYINVYSYEGTTNYNLTAVVSNTPFGVGETHTFDGEGWTRSAIAP